MTGQYLHDTVSKYTTWTTHYTPRTVGVTTGQYLHTIDSKYNT